jgi:hypothetical protein
MAHVSSLAALDDIPLTGGRGRPEDPFVLASATPAAAAHAQLQVLRALGKQHGRSWRLKGLSLHEAAGAQLVEASVVLLNLHPEGPALDRTAYFFRLPAIPDLSAVLAVRDAGGYRDRRSGLVLPFQLSWLHLENVIDHESTTPGRGCSGSYETDAVQGTVYLYDQGQPLTTADLDSPRFHAEFADATRQIKSVLPDAVYLDAGVTPAGLQKRAAVIAMFKLPDARETALLLTARSGVFVKCRFSWQARPELRKMAVEAMAELVGSLPPAAT